MSDTNGAAGPPAGNAWRQHLRQGVGHELIEVRYSQSGEDVRFLLVHRPGARHEAIVRFLDAVRGDDLPPFEVITIEAARFVARANEFRDYAAV